MNEPLTKIVSLFGLAPRGVYPAAFVTKRADALLPRRFTHHLFEAGLFSVALVVVRSFVQTPGRYPARRPSVFGLSSFEFSKAITRLASLHSKIILTKSVQQLQFKI